MPGVIVSNQPFRNQSGIGHDIAKIQSIPQPPPWTEVDGYKEHYRDGKLAVSRNYSVPWGKRPLFFEYMLGYSYSAQSVVIGGGGGGPPPAPSFFLSRIVPAQDPERPWLYCRDVELVQPQGKWVDNTNVFAVDANGQVIVQDGNGNPIKPIHLPCVAYQDASGISDGLAVYTATFMDVDYEIRNDQNPPLNPNVPVELGRWVSRKYTYASQNIPLANLKVVFAAGPHAGQTIPEAGPGLILTGQDCVFEWHEVPDTPEAAFDLCVGSVNLQAFDGLNGYPQFPAGTLLCMAPAKQRFRSKVGRVYWEIKYHMLYKNTGTFANPRGWNYFPDIDGNFYLATYANGTPIFPSADFNTLFEAPAPATYQ